MQQTKTVKALLLNICHSSSTVSADQQLEILTSTENYLNMAKLLRRIFKNDKILANILIALTFHFIGRNLILGEDIFHDLLDEGVKMIESAIKGGKLKIIAYEGSEYLIVIEQRKTESFNHSSKLFFYF